MTLGSKRVRPPIPVAVVDLKNLARLVLNRPDPDGLFWSFTLNGERIVGSLFLIPYWKGNLPLFCYARLEGGEEPKAFLAYRSIGQEEAFFSNSGEDPRYVYGAIMDIESPPEFILRALKTRSVEPGAMPVMTRARNMNVLIRTMLILAEEGASPPIWSFRDKDASILGVITPVFDYYDVNALPVFLYVERGEDPSGGFLRYMTQNGREEAAFVDSVSEMKYFYARVVRLNEMPLWRRERDGGGGARRKTVGSGLARARRS
jgi:hypothetical protein